MKKVVLFHGAHLCGSHEISITKDNKVDYQSFAYILGLNKKLSYRTKTRFPYMYRSIVVLFSMLIFALFLLASSTEIIVIEEGGEYNFVVSIFVLLLLADAMLTMIRYQNSSIVEPYHYSLLPVSMRAIVFWNIIQMLYDYKSILYLSILLAILFHLFFHSYYVSIPILAFLIITYAAMINVLMYVCYLSLYKYLLRARSIVVAIVILAIGVFNVMSATGNYDLFRVLLIIEIPSRGAGSLMNGKIVSALMSILSMATITITGILFLRILSKYMYPVYSAHKY